MRSRTEAARYSEKISRNDVRVRLVPAGHVLGSAQVVLTWKGITAVISGDYKRRRDPTCPAFEPVPCNLFVSEATFGLPVFHFPDASDEIAKLLHSVALFPERTHLVGAYALGVVFSAVMLFCVMMMADNWNYFWYWSSYGGDPEVAESSEANAGWWHKGVYTFFVVPIVCFALG